MVTIKIMNEFLHGPIWTCEQDTGLETDGLPFINDDPSIASLAKEIGDLFDSYYEFDSHGQACWFNEEKERADKPHMLELLRKLNTRLDEINDGSFTVIDEETPRVSALSSSH